MKHDSNRFVIMHSVGFAVAVGALTFITDKNVFVFPESTDERYSLALMDYCICKAIVFIVLFALFYGFFTLLFSRGELKDSLWEVVKCAALYLPLMAVILYIKIPEGFLSNDEYSICNNAVNLVHDTWFNYMTVYYYIVSFMLIPVTYAPIITKIAVELLVIGYCVYRSRSYFGKKAGSFMYILFLLYPVIAYTTSAHRLPVYFLLYLLVFDKLLFDLLEKKDISWFMAFLVMFAGAVLTQWRTEGIYLLVLIPILMLIVYPRFRNRKTTVVIVLSYIAIQYILSIPQNGVTSDNLGGAANDRMKPFYAYTITNMYRNGLDTVKNSKDLETVDRYLSTDAIEAINEHYEDINYEDVLILIKEEFKGVREDAGYTQYYDFTKAVQNIILNNPDVFIRTRWGAFCYSALPFHISFSGTGVRELISFAVSVIKSLSYNLFIPLVFIAVCCPVSLIMRRWYSFFVFAALLAHWAIVFILAPASYFKYYFPVYIMAYFYMIVLLIWYFSGRKKGLSCPVI